MGAPRMTQSDKWKKRPVVMRYRAFKDSIRLHVGKVPDPGQVIALSWIAYFSPPASWSKKKRKEAIGTLCRAKPDRDNVDKAVLDALFSEDSGIAQGSIEKRWGEPARLEIFITVKD